MVNKSVLKFVILVIFCLNFLISSAQEKAKDPYKDDYVGYKPDFVEKSQRWKYTEKEMERSSEVKFYSLNEVEEVNRANALVKVAIESENSGDYRKAMTMYQDIITKFSIANDHNEILYRISEYGVFVPIAQYCQRRLLNFPKEHLDFFRTLKDPEAKELFDEAVKKYSLELFSEIVDKYLATSYGGRALLFLGDAALDRGNYLEALEHFNTIVKYIPDKTIQTPELNLKIQFCQKALGQNLNSGSDGNKSNFNEKDLQLLKAAIQKESPNIPKIFTQKSSSDYVSGDDYTRFAPSTDPLGLTLPEWETGLLDSRNDRYVFTQPVVTDTSIVLRHKNIIYSYSLINGNLRWKNDMGGRAVWQDWPGRQYPLEDLVIQDGVVVTPIYKGGASLVALDEITGQVKWSYGPMSASDGEESLMRFENAPAGGPGTIYANYVLDNIKGDTHIDSEYGVIAFDSTTGRVKWRRQVCRLQPGKFDGSFGTNRRNRIRSFFSPPLYHEGTVYVSPNAGAIAAMDSLSGRIKWLMRYPYYPSVHDLTRQFGTFYDPSLNLNQRPLIVGEALYIVSVNSPFIFSVDRKTGKVNWTIDKPTGGFGFFLGPISTGELVFTGNGRAVPDHAGRTYHQVYLVDPASGKITWKSMDYILPDSQPVMNSGRAVAYGLNANGSYFENGARPFLTEDDKLIMTSWNDQNLWWRPGMHIFSLGEFDLKNKKVTNRRRYYTGALLAHADMIIFDKTSRGMNNVALGAPLTLEEVKMIPRRTPQQDEQVKMLEKIIGDSVPVNEHPPFMPFSRITFNRFSVPFELRVGPRKISMVYSRPALESKLSSDQSLNATFAKSELSIKDGDYKKASEYLNQCLTLVSPEDINFRALIKQQFYKVYLELVRASIRAKKPKVQLENALGMSNTASVLAEEIETLFALAEAFKANGNFKNAAMCLRTLIEVYGYHEYPISSLSAKSIFQQNEMKNVQETLKEIFTEAKVNAGRQYQKEVSTSLDLISQGSALYFSAVSPLPKELNVRTGDLAIINMIDLLKSSQGYEAEYSKMGDAELAGDKVDQLIYHIWKYPNTSKGQETFNRIIKLASSLPEEDKRAIWRKLGHIANICNFKLPSELSSFYDVSNEKDNKDINPSFGDKTYEIPNLKDAIMITMDQEGDTNLHPDLLFLSVKIPKKIGFRFSVICFDVSSGKEVWRKEEFRLKDLGKEPGFFKAYIFKDTVVINGMYDVFGFNVKDGAELWHYKTPYSFETYEATISGNLFILSGASETIALQIDTKSPVGEVAWQQKEDGNIYYKTYFVDDQVISLRKFPFNITSRYRTTGSLMGRLAIPDLTLVEDHPILKTGEQSLPVARFQQYLAVSDEKYLLVYDVKKMELKWKTPLSNVDYSKDVKLRLAINDKYLTLIKEDYDRKAIYCYSVETGEILWCTDPTNSGSPQPIYSMVLEGDMLYGLGEHAGQGFYMVAYDCTKGVRKYYKAIEGYGSIPIVRLREKIYGKNLVVELQDRKNFEALAIDKTTGQVVKKVEDKGDGPIGEIGRVSIAVQNGHMVLFSKMQFKY